MARVYQIGYARELITAPLAEQVATLRRVRCHNIWEEIGDDPHWPKLRLAMMDTRPGDVLVVARFDCLAIPNKTFLKVLATLQRDGIHLRVLDGKLDTREPGGHAIIPLLQLMANLKRSAAREATIEGLEAAREQGRVGGRPVVLDNDRLAAARQLLDLGHHSMKEIAALLNVSRSSLYNAGLASGRAHKIKGRQDRQP